MNVATMLNEALTRLEEGARHLGLDGETLRAKGWCETVKSAPTISVADASLASIGVRRLQLATGLGPVFMG